MSSANQAVWINSYFANHAALALLVAHKRDPHPQSLKVVGRWLQWYAIHQNELGIVNDYEGTIRGGYRDLGTHDSVDSYAALHLLTVERYQREIPTLSATETKSAERSLNAIQSVFDAKLGLTIAKPDYRVMYLMDNVEVYGGLCAAKKLFQKIGRKQQANQAERLSKLMAAVLPQFYRHDRMAFAYVEFPSGKFETKVDAIYPGGLAQLFGMAWIGSNQRELWMKVQNFRPQNTAGAAAGIERFLIAAERQATPKQLRQIRHLTIATARRFTPNSVYIQRPSLVILALSEGADWMPSIANGSGSATISKPLEQD